MRSRSAARAFGAEIRTDAAVERVLVKDGRATGVALASGDEIARADRGVGARSAAHVHASCVDPKELPDDLVEGVAPLQVPRLVGQGEPRAPRAARASPACRATGPHLRGAISISPSIEYLERAYDDAKYGEFSRHPYMDIVIPSMIDPGMAPPGKHVMSIFVQYAPYHLNGGWTDAKREAFGDAVIKTLARYAPNIESLILHRQVLTPADIERITGLSEGNIFQGELALQQLFFLRPVPRVGEVPHADPRLLAVRRRARTRAAASWARRAGSRRSRSCRDGRDERTRLRRDRDRRGRERARRRGARSARAGLRVLCSSARTRSAARARSIEFAPGFRAAPLGARCRLAAADRSRAALGLDGSSASTPTPPSSVAHRARRVPHASARRRARRRARSAPHSRARRRRSGRRSRRGCARLAGFLEALYQLPAPDIDARLARRAARRCLGARAEVPRARPRRT